MPPERVYAIVANLIDRFHLRPEDIGRLTDRQVYGLYFHRREKDGSIPIPGAGLGYEAPEGPMTLERELGILDVLAGFGKWDQAYTAGLKAELRVKYAARNGA